MRFATGIRWAIPGSRRRFIARVWTGAFLAVGGARALGADGSGTRAALASAQRLAMAIRNDDEDRAEALQWVAEAHLRQSNPAAVAGVFGAVEHWRRLAALSDAAAAHAALGQETEAKRLLDEVSGGIARIGGWQRDRVNLHFAKALAMLGEDEIVDTLANRYEGIRDYRGRARAARALALVRAGRGEEARAALDELESDDFYDTKVWHALGHFQLAEQAGADRERATDALERAWAAVGRIPGYQRFRLQFEALDALAAAGSSDSVLTRLTEATGELKLRSANPHLIAPLVARCALSWARAGVRDRVSELEKHAEPMIADLQMIDQPAQWALWGEAWAAAGDQAAALDRFHRAVEIARELANPRPRALAGVTICLSVARAGMEDSSLAAALQRLEDTFLP